jgi:DNA-binding IclR family transcriptional regulator
MAVVKSADRVIQIFEAIASRGEGITHGELSEALGIPKGSLSFLLSNLVHRDYVTFDRLSKRYRLGPGLLVLTSRFLAGLDIVRAGRPVLSDLVREINEDAELAVMKGTQILILHKEDCARPLKHAIAIGDRGPVYATAAGKAILAYLRDDEISRYLSSVRLARLAKHTITDPKALVRELGEIRSRGLAYGREELYDGVTAVAAPVFNLYETVAGSIVVTLPSFRFTPERERFIEPRLRKAAAIISRELGSVPAKRGGQKTIP